MNSIAPLRNHFVVTRCALILVAAFIAVALHAAQAYEPAALTSDGRLVRANENDRRKPWNVDRLQFGLHDYPYLTQLARHHQGKGWFRLELRSNGTVAAVKVMQTTGSVDLDEAGIAAFSRWRFKPGKWKWVDEAMVFTRHAPDRGNFGPPAT